jgi:hypothetical protein
MAIPSPEPSEASSQVADPAEGMLARSEPTLYHADDIKAKPQTSDAALSSPDLPPPAQIMARPDTYPREESPVGTATAPIDEESESSQQNKTVMGKAGVKPEVISLLSEDDEEGTGCGLIRRDKGKGLMRQVVVSLLSDEEEEFDKRAMIRRGKGKEKIIEPSSPRKIVLDELAPRSRTKRQREAEAETSEFETDNKRRRRARYIAAKKPKNSMLHTNLTTGAQTSPSSRHPEEGIASSSTGRVFAEAAREWDTPVDPAEGIASPNMGTDFTGASGEWDVSEESVGGSSVGTVSTKASRELDIDEEEMELQRAILASLNKDKR